MDTIVRERAEGYARRHDISGPGTVWRKKDTKVGELCLVAKRVDGVWRGIAACGNMAWGPMETDAGHSYKTFERLMVAQAAMVISELKIGGQWVDGVHRFA